MSIGKFFDRWPEMTELPREQSLDLDGQRQWLRVTDHLTAEHGSDCRA